MAHIVGNLIVHGEVEPGFEEVESAFQENFATRGEIGAACVVYERNRKVVDLWGGYKNFETRTPWEEDTLVLVFSATKGASAMAMEVAHSRGLFDYEAPVASYWPEFAQQGKAAITVRQLLSHQAGLSAIDEPLTVGVLSDPNALASILAKQKPAWEPGTRHGYHGISLGWFESALMRRVDPLKRSLGQFFQDEIARPLGLEFYIGTPSDLPESRIARIYGFRALEMLFHMNAMSMGMILAYMNPHSLTRRSMQNPKVHSPADFNSPAWRAVEFPAGGGVGQVRSLAKAYGEFATGGKDLGITPEAFTALTSSPRRPSRGVYDKVVKTETAFSLGFMKPFADFPFGTNEKSFGTPGVGGAFGYADPESQIGYTYAPNKLGFTMWNDPRDKALRDALGSCLRKTSF